jgi:hypothetical protein
MKVGIFSMQGEVPAFFAKHPVKRSGRPFHLVDA